MHPFGKKRMVGNISGTNGNFYSIAAKSFGIALDKMKKLQSFYTYTTSVLVPKWSIGYDAVG